MNHEEHGMSGATGNRTLYLDHREGGIGEIKQLLWEKIYQHHPEIPEEKFNERDAFELFIAALKASKFPGIKMTGRGTDKYEYPSKLPKDMNRSGFGTEECYDTLYKILNRENRDTRGYVDKTSHGTISRGFTPPNAVKEEIIINLIDWMADKIGAKRISLPKIKSYEPPLRLVRAETLYSPHDQGLREAFCRGLGLDPAPTKESFVSLFRKAYRSAIPIIGAETEGKFHRGFINFTKDVSLDTLLMSPKLVGPNPDTTLVGQLVAQIETINNDYTHFSDTAAHLMSVETAEQMGKFFTHFQKIKQQNQQPDAPVSAAAETTHRAKIGRLTITLTPGGETPERIAETGQSCTVHIRDANEPDRETEKRITLPRSERPDDFLRSVTSRLGRFKPGCVGLQTAELAIDECLRQHGRG